MDITKENINPNPGDSANPLSKLFFGYTIEMFKKGYKKNLSIDDLYNPLRSDKSSLLGNELERTWREQLSKAKKNNKKPSLLKAILASFWVEYLYLGILQAINDVIIRVVQSQVLGCLLSYFKPDTTLSKNDALFYAGSMVTLSFLGVLTGNQFKQGSYHAGIQLKAACSSLIYRKALKLNRTALSENSSGKMINLLSNDVGRFDAVLASIHHLWSGPLLTIIIMILLYYDCGLAGLLGAAIVFAIIPIQSYGGKLTAKFRGQTAAKTDERVKLMDEIISGIRIIKMYGWEKPFAKIIQIARQKELNIIMNGLYVKALFNLCNLLTMRLALFATFLTMLLTGQDITAAKAFVFMAYLQGISSTMVAMFARAVAEVSEVRVSIKRMQDFLISEEYNPLTFPHAIEYSHEKMEKVLILQNLTVKWNKKNDQVALSKIDLNLSYGSLLGIIGPVGSGKSSLLQTILGELEVVEGSIKVNGTLSYASQDPWIFGTTIQQNIIFNQKFERKRYDEVVRICALEKDFKNFENGDLTIVGDRGASLSGGQKSRINLARAVYKKADIYLFDDPLATVDIRVSGHIYEQCIKSFLVGSTRILVTHQLQYLQDADNIIILNNGCIEDQGTFNTLEMSNNKYAKLLNTETEESQVEEHEQQVKGSQLSIPSIISEESISEMEVTESEKRGEEEGEKEKELLLRVKEMQESSSKGKVQGNLFFRYLFSGGGYCFVFIVLAVFVTTQLVTSGLDYYVGYWLDVEELRNKSQALNVTSEPLEILDIHPLEWSNSTFMWIYAGILTSLSIIALLRSIIYNKLTIRCSKNLHSIIFNNVVASTMNFFETNPDGRILNRFSKDMGCIDESLPKFLSETAYMFLGMTGSLSLVIYINPLFVVMILSITIFFGFIRKVYLKSSKNLKRLEGMTKSPVFTHLKATVDGLSTIRVFGAEDILIDEFDKHQDYNTSASYMFLTTTSAFGFALHLCCSIFVGVFIFSFLVFENYLGALGGRVGLAITQATAITGTIQWAMRMYALVANQLVSVERILEYESLPKEIQPEVPKLPPVPWPSKGEIIFKNMGLRYSAEGPLVLKNVTLTIESKEKVGIVGRTGAGKSSLISALFRLAWVEGSIIIDGVDTGDMSLEHLRKNMSIIPQDPILFPGTLRYNLDPFGEYTDDVLYKAIEDVELKDPANIIDGLDNKVTDRGSNYSVGQRQLICLARAILRNNKILILDEATANVDPQTDALIQKTIRTKFVDCTVLTIAHRLNTIMDSNKVLVIDEGRIIEFDHPHLLLQSSKSSFHRMVRKTGKASLEQLKRVASDNFQQISK